MKAGGTVGNPQLTFRYSYFWFRPENHFTFTYTLAFVGFVQVTQGHTTVTLTHLSAIKHDLPGRKTLATSRAVCMFRRARSATERMFTGELKPEERTLNVR